MMKSRLQTERTPHTRKENKMKIMVIDYLIEEMYYDQNVKSG
jgi:hypothetical protein